jgi:hypothetical protein
MGHVFGPDGEELPYIAWDGPSLENERRYAEMCAKQIAKQDGTPMTVKYVSGDWHIVPVPPASESNQMLVDFAWIAVILVATWIGWQFAHFEGAFIGFCLIGLCNAMWRITRWNDRRKMRDFTRKYGVPMHTP